jgi:hypothetical protein
MAESKPSSTQKSSEQDAPKTETPDAAEILSSEADKSTYKANPDPNPDDVYPAPGPSTIQEAGKP